MGKDTLRSALRDQLTPRGNDIKPEYDRQRDNPELKTSWMKPKEIHSRAKQLREGYKRKGM